MEVNGARARPRRADTTARDDATPTRTVVARCLRSSAPISRRVDAARGREHGRRCRLTHAGSLRFPRYGTGARYGASDSTRRRSSGTRRMTSSSVHFLKVTMPLNDTYQPTASAASASAAEPVKQCSTPTTPPRPASTTIARVSSSASRVWTTTGRRSSAASASWRRTRRAARRAASGRSGSRARTRRWRRRRAPRPRGCASRSRAGSKSAASCGCTPAV